MENLSDQARLWGIASGYHDVFGHWHAASELSVRAVVAALAAGRTGPSLLPEPQHAERAFQGDDEKVWGLAIQLYALRSSRNWGIGDFSDLREAISVAARAGASAVGLNPLHALFLDRPEAASPYGPSSRIFLNPLYIAVDALPDFEDTSALAERRAALRSGSLVDYAGVASLKLGALRLCYERFKESASAKRTADFAAFKAEHGETLRRFACFEVLCRRFQSQPWWDWPQPWRDPDRTALDSLYQTEADACGFVEYLQWVADRQLAACRDEAKRLKLGIGLYLDLAVGVDPAGADAWSHQRAVVAGVTIGAPPDAFNLAGQNWGLAPFNPHGLADNDFAALRTLLGSAMRYAGAVRLDHVIGLMRLYLVPHGAPATDGVYVSYPLEAQLSVIAQESNRHRCVFIGEDLGTVPAGYRETAQRWGVWTYRVTMFERWPNGDFKPPSDYPADALAAFNTHDLPTYRGWITGRDLEIRRGIGIDPGEDDGGRARARDALLRQLQPYAGPNDLTNFAAAAGFLAATPSRLVMVAIDDLLDLDEHTNIPGTVDEYPNWRRVLPVAVEHWNGQPTFRAVKAAFDHAGRGRYGA
jgi:4-alpha-glucanotransferase